VCVGAGGRVGGWRGWPRKAGVVDSNQNYKTIRRFHS
jgi:hypothetical protein